MKIIRALLLATIFLVALTMGLSIVYALSSIGIKAVDHINEPHVPCKVEK